MPQSDEEASAVEEALKDVKDAVVANLNAAEVLQRMRMRCSRLA
jgi:hypothetical protein